MTALERLKWKASLIIVATFALGALTGAALDRIYLQAGRNDRDAVGRRSSPILEDLRHDLQLSDDQIVAIRNAMAQTRQELRSAQLEQCPGMADARQRLMSRIRPLLTPAQRQRFDAVMGRREMQRDGFGRDERQPAAETREP